MSRTVRKPVRAIKENEEAYIKRCLHRPHNFSSKTVRRRKSQDEYEAEYKAAWDQYAEDLKKASYDEFGRPFISGTSIYNPVNGKWEYCWGRYLHQPRISRYHRVEISWSVDQEIEELKKEYRKFSRDGHWNQTGKNTGFKKAAAKATRINNRKLEYTIMKDEEYDRLSYPNEHDGDYLRWNFY